jgi:UDP-glucose 4-epimerase
MQTVLVTGGAGYVGSHACLRLAEAGFRPVVFDNLVNGHRDFVRWGALEVGDIRDRDRLEAVFAKHRPAAVLHFAGLIEVGESVLHPGRFYDNNVAGSICLIEAARRAQVSRLVFSSTCAVYGDPVSSPMDERHPRAPLNPYGRGKLMVEEVLRDLDRSEGFRFIALRYFNAAGADPEGRLGELHEPETHAIPLAIRAALDARQTFRVFGEDYPTRDGTAERDYVHVLDLADAHVLALRRLLQGGPSDAFNLGTGAGRTVNELIAAVRRRARADFKVERAARRAGDAAVLVADSGKARAELGWSPRYDFEEIMASAWRWHTAQAGRREPV